MALHNEQERSFRSKHEWYREHMYDVCRHCGIKAVTPKQVEAADVLIPCVYPNSYPPDVILQAMSTVDYE